jgi:osmotically-inducible protein OsmY
VNWELRKDPRFAEVNASCTAGTVTLKGRVDSKGVETDAVKIAESGSRGTRVVSALEIRPR